MIQSIAWAAYAFQQASLLVLASTLPAAVCRPQVQNIMSLPAQALLHKGLCSCNQGQPFCMTLQKYVCRSARGLWHFISPGQAHGPCHARVWSVYGTPVHRSSLGWQHHACAWRGHARQELNGPPLPLRPPGAFSPPGSRHHLCTGMLPICLQANTSYDAILHL